MLFLLSVSSLPNVREYSSAASYKAAVASAPGTYVNYKWPTESQPLSSMMEVDHVWTSIPDGTDTHGNGVFASSQMWWHADNGTQLAGGYMGSQVMRGSGGEERRVFIFSCWDHSADNKVGWTTPDTCSRFGGEGVGSHCILDYPTKAGTLYNFTLSLDGHNATGARWTGRVLDTSSGKSTLVGTLFMPHVDTTVGYGKIGVNSNEFLEYFAGGDCDTAVHVAVGTFGPYFNSRANRPTAAFPAYGSGDCKRTLVTGCIPGWGCGAPRVWVEGGKGTARNNSDDTPLWGSGRASAAAA